MPATSPTLHWDIFCNVIDNYGDIGVCWRLARQLAAEFGFAVRLWVDDLSVFQRLCPEIRQDQPEQRILGVNVRHWTKDFPDAAPGDIVVEAFACRLPECFEAAMAERTPKPVWINLDYLSAEAWVSGCHTLPSPHPQLPLTKYFFFPGLTEDTGGLLRERDLDERRQEFITSPSAQHRFFEALGIPPSLPGTLQISLFSYENQAVADLLSCWANGRRPVRCLAPLTQNRRQLEAFTGQTLCVGDSVQRGQIEICIIPFIPQPEYDKLLWICDVNFVRGEDSFVRAQWAAKPMVWQIYPQEENAHQAKLKAFLDIYCASLDERLATIAQTLFMAWNGDSRLTITESWEQWESALQEFQRHAEKWQKKLIKQQDLCNRLVQFCRSKL